MTGSRGREQRAVVRVAEHAAQRLGLGAVCLGVSPLRGAGLSRCASSHRGTDVSPLTGFHP